MRRSASLLLISTLALAAGCGQTATNQQPPSNQQPPTTNQTAATSPGQTNAGAATPAQSPSAQAAAAKGDVDPCSLLTSAELQAVQGEPLKETKANQQAAGGLLNLQCFYTLPTFSNSVSLALTERDPTAAGGRTAKQYWQETFHEREAAAREAGKGSGEKSKARGEREAGGRGEEEERSAAPEPVPGLGDEAFWSANRVGGALYVLKGERFVMLSVGGRGDAEEKLKKAKALARDALKRL
jgi:hypothetical protein